MRNAKLSVENLCGLLIRSRLQPVESVKGLYQRWKTASNSPHSLADFARWLVMKRYVTPYQATLLCNGYADNFFLGPYRILERIGKGRMAGVYKAVHFSGQLVAIKVLPPSKARDPSLFARFQREGRLATQLNHFSIVQTFEIGEHNRLHYLVMEYLEGETLQTLLKRRGKLPVKEAVRIAFLAAVGLQHIHEKGMVHRDLKSGNLMLCPAPGPEENTLRSAVKILDIGLGRMLFNPKSRETEDLTGEGTILGSPDYLAPEQARDSRRADIRADIYSLGCTLYQALAGQPPFPDNNPVRQILRHATQQPTPLMELNPEVPVELDRLVQKMLAKDAADRFQTPAEAADALKAFLAGETETPRAATDSAEWRAYLQWLHGPRAASEPTPAVKTPTIFELPPSLEPPPVARPLPTAQRVLKEKRQKLHAARPPVAKVVPPTAPVGPANSDDLPQLVGVQPPKPPASAATTLDDDSVFVIRISRDVLMVLLGVLGVLAVGLVAWLVMR